MMHSVLKKASWGTRCVFGGTLCKKQASLVRQGYSVPETPSYGTELALGAQNSLLRYATHFLKHSVLKTGFSGTRCVFGGTLCKKQASLVRKGYSVPETPSYGTE